MIRIGNGVFSIVTLVAFTRLLSPEEYGAYALYIAVASVVSAILFQWLNLAVGRFYPIYLDNPGKVMAFAARGFWGATAMAALFFLGVLPFHEGFGSGPALYGLLFLITVMLGLHTLALQVANAQLAPIRYGLLSWAKSGGALLVGFVFIRYGFSEWGALLGFLTGLVFAVLAFAPMPWMMMKLNSVDARLSTEMFRYSLPLTLNYLSILIVDLADRFMIGKMLGAAHLAPYAVAYDLVQQLVGPAMNVLFLVAFPLIVKAFEGEGDQLTRIRLHTLGSRLVGLGLPVAVGIGLLADDIAEIILGNEYRQDAVVIIPWLAGAIFVGAFKSYFLDIVFQLRHATKYQGYIAILMATINILLNLLLLPQYGVIAAAWATLGAFTLGALASLIVGASLFLLPALWDTIWRSVFASAIMAVMLYMLPSSVGIIWFFTKIILAIVTYAFIAWVLDIAGFRILLKVWPIFQ